MLINVHGHMAGSVSGGCLERNVITQARAALMDGRSRLLAFDTTDNDDLAFGSSLGCQGKIWIGLEVLAVKKAWPLEGFVADVRQRRSPAVLITRINDDETFEVTLEREHTEPHVSAVLKERKSLFDGATVAGGRLLEYLPPPLSLVLFGGNHDITPMLRLGLELGHDVTIVDRRPEFAAADRFPGAKRVVAVRPHEISSRVTLDQRTAAVVMNHHYDTDRDVLAALLPLGLPHIAVLGPKRRTERILAELDAEGHDVEAVRSTIFGPAGLDIGADTPEQIALSVLAEIQASLSGRGGGSLRARNAPIHGDNRSPLACPVPA